MQHQPLANGQVRIGIDRLLLAEVARTENDPVGLGARKDMRIGEAVDGRVENGAAVLVAVGREIRPAAGQSKPERSARPDVGTFRKAAEAVRRRGVCLHVSAQMREVHGRLQA